MLGSLKYVEADHSLHDCFTMNVTSYMISVYCSVSAVISQNAFFKFCGNCLPSNASIMLSQILFSYHHSL